MNLEEERESLHERMKLLIGRSFCRVRYAAVDYFDNKSYWNCYKDFHLAEFGVELTASDGIAFNVGWDWKFHQHEITVQQVEGESLWNDAAVLWDVTGEPLWASLVEQVVVKATIYWNKVGTESSRSPDYPQDLEVEFGSGQKVWFCAAGYDEKADELFGMHDEVVIISDEEVLCRYKLGAHTPKEWLSQVTEVK